METSDLIATLHSESGSKNIFEYLKSDKAAFCETVAKCYGQVYIKAGCIIDVDETRLLEAYVLWLNDLDRVKQFEMHGSIELDHFKQAAHLSYWLRRVAPILSVQNAEEGKSKQSEALYKVLVKYGNQYCALDLGFHLCGFFEANRVGSKIYSSDYELDNDFSLAVSHFLKTKNVSPHAMFLIFKSMFYNPIKS